MQAVGHQHRSFERNLYGLTRCVHAYARDQARLPAIPWHHADTMQRDTGIAVAASEQQQPSCWHFLPRITRMTFASARWQQLQCLCPLALQLVAPARWRPTGVVEIDSPFSAHMQIEPMSAIPSIFLLANRSGILVQPQCHGLLLVSS